jgi:hypothetical protein
VINFIDFLFIESIGLCSGNETTSDKSLWIIPFGSGSDQYYDKSSSSFNFSTTHQQQFQSTIGDGWFGFLNALPMLDGWHGGALDHTANDMGGYMYFMNVGSPNSQIFNFTINDLCIGLRYEFSAYLANVIKKQYHNLVEPSVLFQVRTETDPENVIAELSTGNIPACDNMTWSRYGLTFIATSRSVYLLMISKADGDYGNDLAIDDIEFRICSTQHSGFCPPG